MAISITALYRTTLKPAHLVAHLTGGVSLEPVWHGTWPTSISPTTRVLLFNDGARGGVLISVEGGDEVGFQHLPRLRSRR